MGEIDSHLRKFQKELSAGTVSLVLLSVLGQSKEPMYGHPGVKELVHGHVLSDFSKSDRPWVVALCEAIAENAGLLASEVEPSVAGPPRRYYRITDQGRDVLAAWTDNWQATREFVDTVLQGTQP